MSKIKCKLISVSNSVFLQQIYTGFFLLYKNGLIDLDQIIIKEKKSKQKKDFLGRIHNHHIRVILNDEILLYYDLRDGKGISQKDLDESSFYFKRSYHPEFIKSLGEQKEKIFPYGLNYAVYPSSIDKFALKRNFFLSIGAKKFLAGLRTIDTMNINRFSYLPRLNELQSMPNYNVPPKIIFIVKAYDPYDNPDRSEKEIEERVQINETRAECISLLQAEFGSNFYGGFYHTKVSNENYKKYLIQGKKNTSKRNYLNLLKKYPICIASAGLHGSIGWKFAEYIGLSKAIVAEKMKFRVTGDLQKGINYLEFTTPKECVECAARLFHDKKLRINLMIQNARYYHNYLRPDALILNTILTALSEQQKIKFRITKNKPYQA